MRKQMSLALLLLLLLLLGTSPAAAVVQQNSIVIEAKNEPLSSVLKRLEKATNYKMMYANDDVFGVKVNKTVKASGVRQALDQVLAGTGLNYTIDKQFVTIKKAPFVGSSTPTGDAFIVNGHVYDESGLDVPGVTVMIVGTDKGTATDVDGRFSLKVRAGDHPFIIGMEKSMLGGGPPALFMKNSVNCPIAHYSLTMHSTL